MKRKDFILSACFITLMLYSCGGSKQMPNNYYNNPQTISNNNDYGNEVKNTPAEDYALAAPGKRASGSGKSWSENVAQQAAEADARRAFSEKIDVAITSALKRANVDMTQYAGDDNSAQTGTDGGQKQNALIKSISQNIVANTYVVKKNKYYNSKNKIYTIFVCLEYGGEVSDLAEKTTKQIMQRVTDDDRMKIQKELDAFEQEIENNLQRTKE